MQFLIFLQIDETEFSFEEDYRETQTLEQMNMETDYTTQSIAELIYPQLKQPMCIERPQLISIANGKTVGTTKSYKFYYADTNNASRIRCGNLVYKKFNARTEKWTCTVKCVMNKFRVYSQLNCNIFIVFNCIKSIWS